MDETGNGSTGRSSGRDHLFRRFATDETGATAIEYALMATGIGVTVATAVYSLGTTVLVNFYERIADATSAE